MNKITIDEVCKILGYSKMSIYIMISKGKIKTLGKEHIEGKQGLSHVFDKDYILTLRKRQKSPCDSIICQLKAEIEHLKAENAALKNNKSWNY